MDSHRLIASPTWSAAEFPLFKARAPWWGGDLQTLRNFLVRRRAPITASPELLRLPMRDGSGDCLVGALHTPEVAEARRPLVILLHGLSGSQESPYILQTASHLLAMGFPVLRLNLRGAGPSRPLCRFQYHAGRTEDFADVIAALPPERATAGIVAIGYSLGANMLLKYLGEHGSRSGLKAAVAVSAPLDLAATSRQMMRLRNAVYQRYLLLHMRREALGEGAEVTADERRTIVRARSIWEFDDGFSARRNGFRDAEDYYERNGAKRYLSDIAVPTLIIHALDDPWIPAAPYLAHDWSSQLNLLPLLSRRGGHVGFQGTDRRVPWHDLCASRFLAALEQRSVIDEPK